MNFLRRSTNIQTFHVIQTDRQTNITKLRIFAGETYSMMRVESAGESF